MKTHMFWHSRGYLPHLDVAGELQSLTFRLADAVPVRLIERWRREWEGRLCPALSAAGAAGEEPERQMIRRLQRAVLKYEDAGHGRCELRDPRCAAVVAEALRFFHGTRYDLLEWCVMPNHVHAVVRQREGHRLPDLVRSWKTFTARKINELLGRSGALWARDYFDRYIRDEGHLADARAYVRNNPVQAGLCDAPEQWPWSSAGWP